MTALQKAIQRLQKHEIEDISNMFFSSTMEIQEAISILEDFEVDLINELTCEQLQIKQDGHKYISQM